MLICLLVIGIIHLFIKLTSPLYNNKKYLYSRVFLLMTLGFCFTIMSQNILNQLISLLTKHILLIRISKLENESDLLDFYNRRYCLKQIHKLKIVIYLFFFTILYTGGKSMFYFLLNEDIPEILKKQGIYRVNLYQGDNFVWYSSQNQFERSFLDYAEFFEYSFRIIFGFIFPIFYIMKLIKNECKGTVKIPDSHRETQEFFKSQQDDQDDIIEPIYGLRFS